MSVIQPYLVPILGACIAFPFAAALFTVPFAVRNYPKYGGITILRIVIVYSFGT